MLSTDDSPISGYRYSPPKSHQQDFLAITADDEYELMREEEYKVQTQNLYLDRRFIGWMKYRMSV